MSCNLWAFKLSVLLLVQALASLQCLGDSESKQSMEGMVSYVLDRLYWVQLWNSLFWCKLRMKCCRWGNAPSEHFDKLVCCVRHKVQLNVRVQLGFDWTGTVLCCVQCSSACQVCLWVLESYSFCAVEAPGFLDFYVLPISSQHEGTQAVYEYQLLGTVYFKTVWTLKVHTVIESKQTEWANIVHQSPCWFSIMAFTLVVPCHVCGICPRGSSEHMLVVISIILLHGETSCSDSHNVQKSARRCRSCWLWLQHHKHWQ